MLSSQLICDPAEVGAVRNSWDALAVACRRPMLSPAWGLAWWRHLAPDGAVLRVIVVRDGETVVGVAPFSARQRAGYTSYELLSGASGRMSPLALPGRELEVAESAWTTLLAATPSPDVVRFDSAPAEASHTAWRTASRTRPGRLRAVIRESAASPCPVMPLAGSFDAWLAGKSPHFRGEMRRLRRRYIQVGATIRMSTPGTVDDDLETYLRLHLSRWEGRDETSAFASTAAPLRAALAEMAHALAADRFRLYVTELDGAPICAQLFIAAGGELMFHNGGWDPRHARLKPGLVGILHAIEEGLAHGDRRLDFGPGAYDYKLRFTDENDPVVNTAFVLPGPRLALVAARHAWNAASRRLVR